MRHDQFPRRVSQLLRVLAIKHRIGWSRIAFASVRTCDFLQCDKARYRDRGFPDEITIEKLVSPAPEEAFIRRQQ
jgi:hypothetical protein